MKNTHNLITLIFLLLTCSCTFDYEHLENVPELNETAIIETARMSQGDHRRRLARLEKIAIQTPDPYTLDVGDEVVISVYNNPDLTTNVAVMPDGNIGMMFANQIYVKGLTPSETANKIAEALAHYVNKPVVSVIPTQINSLKVTIAGAVARPGVYNVTGETTIGELFAQAGGSSIRLVDGQDLDAADFNNSIFIRNKKALEVDFVAAIQRGDYRNNIKLRKGDYIYMAARSEAMVSIIGEVNKVHQKIWNNHLGFLEMISSGGGLKETYWKYALIIRGGLANPTLYRIDIDAIMSGKKPNIMLVAGDVVYIPQSKINEYNVFVRKLMPTFQLFSLGLTPVAIYASLSD